MAGSWIKVEACTPLKTEIVNIAMALEITNNHALGLCVAFWCWCDFNLTDFMLTGNTRESIDRIIGQKGFTQAMIDQRWIRESEAGLGIGNVDKHMSNLAKKRAEAAVRAGKSRAGKPNK